MKRPFNAKSLGRLEVIVSLESEPTRLVTGFQFLEGPVWQPRAETLFFSDIIGDSMYSWSEAGGAQLFRRPSHMANGNSWDRCGRLVTCEHATSRVSRTDGGDYRVLASHYEGRELNSPNDVVVSADGAIYFTDPNPGRTAKFGVERPQVLDFQGVFRMGVDSFEPTLLIDDFSKPNGLCFSLDESLLYINDTDRQHIRVFDVAADGSIVNGRLFAETAGKEPGVADGMKVDSVGNIYCCGSGGVHVFDPAGERLGVLRFPELPANFCWGGPGLCDLFVTARTSLYRLRMRLPGTCLFPADV